MDRAQNYIDWFRNTSPYIHAHRQRTFVIALGGEAVMHANFSHIIHDLALLNSLGIRLVLVHGARPQINQALAQRQIEARFAQGRRITDDASLDCVLDATGKVRIQIEALLSIGVANSPMHGASIQVISGNFVTARPFGVHDGIDFKHTGEVRRIHRKPIERQLNDGAIVLLSHIGYSPTGEVFNLSWEEVAEKAAITLQADKLIFFTESPGILDNLGQLRREMTVDQACQLLTTDAHNSHLLDDQLRGLAAATRAVEQNVQRCHFISFAQDGSLLQELFTRDGCGTLIARSSFEQLRTATIEDIPGLLELLEPLERDGTLVRRSRERLEEEIHQFTVLDRDGMIIACAALYPYLTDGMAELACVAVHGDYRQGKRGDRLLKHLEKQALALGVAQLFVLTTRTAHWFQERGFIPAGLEVLPNTKKSLYNLQRKSNVFIKPLQ
jgi:amino-acid N-acetyltransferase